jgi:hypothetical protein
MHHCRNFLFQLMYVLLSSVPPSSQPYIQVKRVLSSPFFCTFINFIPSTTSIFSHIIPSHPIYMLILSSFLSLIYQWQEIVWIFPVWQKIIWVSPCTLAMAEDSSGFPTNPSNGRN